MGALDAPELKADGFATSKLRISRFELREDGLAV